MYPLVWIALYCTGLIWSLIAPRDYFIWILEVFPALIAVAALALTRKRFPLSTLLYCLILAHCLLLMVGGHYTYAEEPLFNRLRELFGWQRNNFDKLGHFFQGLVPAMVAREILIRRAVIKSRAWLNYLILSIVLAISALYELLEWWVAVLSGSAADAFLATQGYVWDTQSDMFFALIGGLCALLLLSRIHDRQLRRLPT